MSVFQDSYFAKTFRLLARDPGGPGVTVNGKIIPNFKFVDLTGASFSAWIRQYVAATSPVLAALSTSGNNGLTILSPPTNGQLQMFLTQAQTSALPLGPVYIDFMRTDLAPQSPQRYFGAMLPVKEPVTRL